MTDNCGNREAELIILVLVLFSCEWPMSSINYEPEMSSLFRFNTVKGVMIKKHILVLTVFTLFQYYF